MTAYKTMADIQKTEAATADFWGKVIEGVLDSK